jgi:hypothetical protein
MAETARGRAGAPGLAAQVLVDGQLGPDEEGLVAALQRCGVVTEVGQVPVRRTAELLAWAVLITLPLQAFLSGLGDKASDDAYAGLTAAIRRILRRTRQPAPPPSPADSLAATPDATPARVMILQDPGTGLRIVLEADLPDEAYHQLLALDLTEFRFGPLHYDAARHRWRSEQDEAAC